MKVGLPDVTDKKALTSHRLHGMNTAQLQVLLNELHSQIESELLCTFYFVFAIFTHYYAQAARKQGFSKGC